MSVEIRSKRMGEKYVVSIPAYSYKEDLKQVVEDDMLIATATLSSQRSWYVESCYALF